MIAFTKTLFLHKLTFTTTGCWDLSISLWWPMQPITTRYRAHLGKNMCTWTYTCLCKNMGPSVKNTNSTVLSCKGNKGKFSYFCQSIWIFYSDKLLPVYYLFFKCMLIRYLLWGLRKNLICLKIYVEETLYTFKNLKVFRGIRDRSISISNLRFRIFQNQNRKKTCMRIIFESYLTYLIFMFPNKQIL